MRSRPVAAFAAAFALVFSVAACGGEEEGAGQPPVPPSQPTAAGAGPGSPTDATTTPTSTPEPDSPASTPAAEEKGEGDEPDAPATGNRPPTRGADADPIPDAAAKNADLTNFTTALGAADLESTLAQDGPFTVFAPNNDGFAKLGTRLDALLQPASKAELANILSFHVVKGDVRMKDLKSGTLLTTLQGTRLRVEREGSEITIGNALGRARVVSADIDAGNGVIHAIDAVLTPKAAK